MVWGSTGVRVFPNGSGIRKPLTQFPCAGGFCFRVPFGNASGPFWGSGASTLCYPSGGEPPLMLRIGNFEFFDGELDRFVGVGRFDGAKLDGGRGLQADDPPTREGTLTRYFRHAANIEVGPAYGESNADTGRSPRSRSPGTGMNSGSRMPVPNWLEGDAGTYWRAWWLCWFAGMLLSAAAARNQPSTISTRVWRSSCVAAVRANSKHFRA